MKNCPYCEDVRYTEYSKEGMRVNYLGNLIPKFELKYGRLLLCQDCENYWYEDYEPYHRYRSLLKTNLQSTLEWNANLPIATENQKTILREIKANPLSNSGSNRDFIDFPVSIYYDGKWFESTIIRFQKLPPFLTMFGKCEDFIRLDAVREVKPSEYALSNVIRSFGDLDWELGLTDRPLITYGPNQKFYSVWVRQNFFFLDGLKGSELKLESFFSKVEGKSINFESSSLPIKYVIADWDEELNKYRA
jgi:hypothetical protein